MISVTNRIPREDVMLGVIRALNVHCTSRPPFLHTQIAAVIDQRSRGLSPAEESRRGAVRDMLRNGKYKPTGRGKPASEYLLRVAPGDFPEISPVVDTANFISLKHLLPVSLWDIEKVGASAYCFRLGSQGESYVFNESDQKIDLQDLIVGCAVPVPDVEPDGEPVVNPVKDSMEAKTNPESAHIAAVVYAPCNAVETAELYRILEEFERMIFECNDSASTTFSIVFPGQTRLI